MSSDTRQFESGAQRSGDADSERYDLISPIGLRRLAETYAEGAAKYGERNWENGFPASVIFNHAVRHLNLWLAGDDSEDHLSHAAWNLFALMHFEETRSDLFDIPARDELKLEPVSNSQGCSPELNCGRCEHRSCDAENFCEIHDDNTDGVQQVYFCPGCNRQLAICEIVQCDQRNAVVRTCQLPTQMFTIAQPHIPIYRIAKYGNPVELAAVRKLGDSKVSLYVPEELILFFMHINMCAHCEQDDDFDLESTGK